VFVSDPRQRIVEFYCRHLVGLCVTYRHRHEAGLRSRFATCSGTLIYVEGALYFLTAGHVLKELQNLRTSEQVEIEDAALADVFGWKRVSEKPIPFDIKSAHLCYIDDDELGLDFGVIPLGPHHARLLAKNGVVALSEINWAHQDGIECDAYVILGFPEEFSSERVSASGDVTVGPTMVPVQRVEPPLEHEVNTTKFPRFVGRLSPKLPLKSLRGMSGGLIIGIQYEPVQRYWVVGLQTSWHRQRRYACGCRLPVLGSLMTTWSREQAPILNSIDDATFVITPHEIKTHGVQA